MLKSDWVVEYKRVDVNGELTKRLKVRKKKRGHQLNDVSSFLLKKVSYLD